MYWVVDADVQMTWIKYEFPLSGSIDYELTDACLCPGMQKIVAGKNSLTAKYIHSESPHVVSSLEQFP